MEIKPENKILFLLTTLSLSAVMLTLIHPPFNLHYLAWVAYAPFIVAAVNSKKLKPLLISAYIISAVYWLANLYWLGPVTWAGCLVFCLYTALLWPLLIIAIKNSKKIKIPLFLIIPLLIVGAEQLQGLFLGGFYWRHLAYSQYRNVTIIQIADLFGSPGVSFLLAMTNALLADMILAVKNKNFFRLKTLVKTAIVIFAISAVVGYGRFRLNQSGKFIEQGPIVAAVQSNVPQSVKESLLADTQIFNELIVQSKNAVKAKAKIIIWPETMVQAVLNPQAWPFLISPENSILFDKKLKEHALSDRVSILAGASGLKPIEKPDGNYEFKRYNSAFLYLPDGTQSPRQYNKIHLVPFGEVVPFKKSAPWIHKLLMMFTPYDYDYSLDYGTEYTIFKTEVEKKQYRFAVMICYEDTVPIIARKFAIDENAQKKVDWLVNISNDGWFVTFKDGKVYPSTELAQHTAICVFRAVENRLAVIRSVNTGLSCLIDSNGRIRDSFIKGSLPRKTMRRAGISGWFADKMPIDRRVTFFSRHGQWLDVSSALIFAAVLFIPVGICIVKKYKRLCGKHAEQDKESI